MLVLLASNSSSSAKQNSDRMHWALIIVISCAVSALFIGGLVAACKYWQKRKRQQQQARFLKLFEDADDIEDELGIGPLSHTIWILPLRIFWLFICILRLSTAKVHNSYKTRKHRCEYSISIDKQALHGHGLLWQRYSIGTLNDCINVEILEQFGSSLAHFHLVFYFTSTHHMYSNDIINTYIACIGEIKYDMKHRFAIEDWKSFLRTNGEMVLQKLFLNFFFTPDIAFVQQWSII